MVTVRDLMTSDPCSVTPATTVRQVIELMHKHDCRQLPVLEDGKLVGIVTDRDIRMAMDSPVIDSDSLKNLYQLDDLTAARCMTTDPIVVTPDMPAHQAAAMLCFYKFGSLPVVENNGLVGIITVTDLLTYMATQGRGGS